MVGCLVPSRRPRSMVIDIGPALLKAKETVNEGQGVRERGGCEPLSGWQIPEALGKIVYCTIMEFSSKPCFKTRWFLWVVICSMGMQSFSVCIRDIPQMVGRFRSTPSKLWNL